MEEYRRGLIVEYMYMFDKILETLLFLGLIIKIWVCIRIFFKGLNHLFCVFY